MTLKFFETFSEIQECMRKNWGKYEFDFFYPDLDPVILVLKLDLDMVHILEM